MKIKIATAELTRVLKQASGVVQGKVTLDVLKYLKIDINGANAVASASDLGMSIIQQFQLASSDVQTGSFLLPAAKVSQILSALVGQAEIAIEVTDKGMEIKAGKYSKAKLPTVPVDQFPQFDSMPAATHTFKLGTLKAQIRNVEIAVPSKEGKFAKPIIHFEGTAEYFRAVATDGFRIAVKDEPSIGVLTMDLPKPALAVISSLSGEDLSFAETETKYFFLTGKEKVIINKSLAKFPAYQKALSATYTTEAAVPPDFKASLDLVAVAVDPEYKVVEVEIGEGKIKLHTNSAEGEAEDALDVISKGQQAMVRLNPDFMSDFIGQTDGQPFTVKMSGEKGPVRFALTDQYQYFLMPVPAKEAAKEKASA